MNTIARDVPAVLQRCIALVEDQRLPLREAAHQTQTEYNRYHAYQLRCVAGATRATLSFAAFLAVEAHYQRVCSQQRSTLDIVALAELERQLALDVEM